jgi:RNA polymerase sigma-70 factor (ECF subfamily)
LTSEHSSQLPAPGDIFATTHWTVVLAAGRRHTPQSATALEELCRTYWFPLYAYVRRRGYAKADAEDLTQAFFAKLLEKNFLAALAGERGKFRAWLLAALKHFLANEWDRARAQKRGGGETHLSLDWQTADTKFQVAAQNEPSPDKAFDREWALALLARVIERLQSESAQRDVAAALGMEEGAVRVAVHRLRKRYRALLRDEIANTLGDPALVDEELRALFGAFGA